MPDNRIRIAENMEQARGIQKCWYCTVIWAMHMEHLLQ